jgi:hypothetical protein
MSSSGWIKAAVKHYQVVLVVRSFSAVSLVLVGRE